MEIGTLLFGHLLTGKVLCQGAWGCSPNGWGLLFFNSGGHIVHSRKSINQQIARPSWNGQFHLPQVSDDARDWLWLCSPVRTEGRTRCLEILKGPNRGMEPDDKLWARR